MNLIILTTIVYQSTCHNGLHDETIGFMSLSSIMYFVAALNYIAFGQSVRDRFGDNATWTALYWCCLSE